jgi:hypothetical protein
MFKAEDSTTFTDKKMAVKTVDRAFLQGQSVELFRAVIKKVKQLPTRMKED